MPQMQMKCIVKLYINIVPPGDHLLIHTENILRVQKRCNLKKRTKNGRIGEKIELIEFKVVVNFYGCSLDTQRLFDDVVVVRFQHCVLHLLFFFLLFRTAIFIQLSSKNCCLNCSFKHRRHHHKTDSPNIITDETIIATKILFNHQVYFSKLKLFQLIFILMKFLCFPPLHSIDDLSHFCEYSNSLLWRRGEKMDNDLTASPLPLPPSTQFQWRACVYFVSTLWLANDI